MPVDQPDFKGLDALEVIGWRDLPHLSDEFTTSVELTT